MNMPDNMLFLTTQIALGVSILTYLLIILCIWRYMRRTAEVAPTDPKWQKSCNGLRSSLAAAVRWGTLTAWLTLLICVLAWLFGSTQMQGLAVDALLENTVIMFASAVLCHLLCTPMLSTMSGSDIRDGFAKSARRLPNRLLFLGLLLMLLHMYLTF
ncbi:MAG: hypothetical protein IJ343_13100 [Clostridia bacterium]|nr:hypothetical protein [Clostridia bacterium]